MKIYSGRPPGFVVVIDEQREVGRPLRLRRKISRDFAWGYAGAGPNELAYDLLYDHLGEEPSGEVVTTFVFRYVVGWPRTGEWRLDEIELAEWLEGFATFCRPGRVTRAEELQGATA